MYNKKFVLTLLTYSFLSQPYVTSASETSQEPKKKEALPKDTPQVESEGLGRLFKNPRTGEVRLISPQGKEIARLDPATQTSGTGWLRYTKFSDGSLKMERDSAV